MKIVPVALAILIFACRLVPFAPACGVETPSHRENEDGFVIKAEELELSDEFSAYAGEAGDRIPTRKILGMQDDKIYFTLANQPLTVPAYPVLDALATYDIGEQKISVIEEFAPDKYFLQDACIFQEELYYVVVDLEMFTAELRSLSGGDKALLKVDAGTNRRCYPRLIIREGRLYLLYLKDMDKNRAILTLTELHDQDQFRNIYEREVALPFGQHAESDVVLENLADDGGDCLIVTCLFDSEHNSGILLTYDGREVDEITVENHVASAYSSGSQILYTLRPEGLIENNNVDVGFYSHEDHCFSEIAQLPQIADMKGLGNGKFVYHYRDTQNISYLASLEAGQENRAVFANIGKVPQPGYFVQGEGDSYLFVQEERGLSAGAIKIYIVQEMKDSSEGQKNK